MKALLLLIAFSIPGQGVIASTAEELRYDMREVLEEVRSMDVGQVYQHGPYDFNPDHLGVALVLIDGTTVEVGDTQIGVPLMSISKIYSYAAAVERRGSSYMAGRIGLNATGLPFDAAVAPERNPLVNLGAIAVHSYLQDVDTIGFFSRLAGETLQIKPEWRVDPMPVTVATAWMMKADDVLDGDPEDAARAYLDACVVEVTPLQLARMGAVLASGGYRGKERILNKETVRQVLSVMSTAGLYEDAGEWLADTGMPAKSGVSGTILAVAPGWGAIAAYSPRLDEAGNSVRAAEIIKRLSNAWGLHFVDRGFH